jgi:hypothetical protein
MALKSNLFIEDLKVICSLKEITERTKKGMKDAILGRTALFDLTLSIFYDHLAPLIFHSLWSGYNAGI